jgi:hypothetical protein
VITSLSKIWNGLLLSFTWKWMGFQWCIWLLMMRNIFANLPKTLPQKFVAKTVWLLGSSPLADFLQWGCLPIGTVLFVGCLPHSTCTYSIWLHV